MLLFIQETLFTQEGGTAKVSKPHITRQRLPFPRFMQPVRYAATAVFACLLLAGSILQAQETGAKPGSITAGVKPGVEAKPDRIAFSGLMRTCWDLSALARADAGVTCKQFSSYDRSGWKGNHDWGNYLRASQEEGNVCAEMEGPGCLLRIWSANPSGKILIYLDGREEPALETGFDSLFNGREYPFLPPLAYYVSGYDAYVPIPYEKSCKIVLRENQPLYYHFGYRSYPRGTAVETFSRAAAEAAKKEVDETVRVLSDPGPHLVRLLYPPESLETVSLNATAEPDKPMDLFTRQGPGRIVLLVLDGSSLNPHFLRTVLLKIYFDDAVQPAVDCPLGDFFGTAFGKNLYRALPMGMTEEGGYCLFPMPFDKGVRIELIQQGKHTVEIKGRVVLAPLPEADDGTGGKGWLRFHAAWRRENPCLDFEYPVLKATGTGKFVGCALFIHNPRERWWGEGDEKIWVDDEEFPSFFGTG
ncbi:MAG: glycoside hydrolase family 172 protein, partial [Planctomycetota bacterium]